MKRLTISTLLSGVLFLTSCNDFLNQEPLDQLSPNEYLTTESNIANIGFFNLSIYPILALIIKNDISAIINLAAGTIYVLYLL